MSHYWWNLTNGQVTCHDHAGAYLTAGITARPKARTHSTPLGKWEVMDPADVADMTAEYGAICDGCRSAQ